MHPVEFRWTETAKGAAHEVAAILRGLGYQADPQESPAEREPGLVYTNAHGRDVMAARKEVESHGNPTQRRETKRIEPSDVATQLKWDIGAITDFCSNVLEEANDHNVSLALRALNADDYELAKEFIDLEAAHADAGELTPELDERRKELVGRLSEAEGAVDESEEDPRDRSARR